MIRLGECFQRPQPEVLYDETQIRGMLMRFDTDLDGRLSRDELRAAFKGFGSRVPGFLSFFALFRADQNHDGHINDQEFELLVKFVKALGYIVK